MKWIKVSITKPKEAEDFQHMEKLYLNTKTYGCFVGFYYKDKFMSSYACEILDVTHWMKLPKGPMQFFCYTQLVAFKEYIT